MDSIINQTYTKIEILVIDDGSTDKSGVICDEYASKDNRIIVVHKNNEGVYSARMDAFKLSSGNLVMFVDGDDYLDSNIIEKMYIEQIKYSVDMVICQYFEVYNNNIVKAVARPKSGLYNKERIIDILKSVFLYDNETKIAGMSGVLWGKLIRRDFVETALRSGEGLFHSEDHIAVFKLLTIVNNMFVMNDRLYFYMTREGQATRTYKPELWDNFELFFDRLRSIDKHNYLRHQIKLRELSIVRMLIYLELIDQAKSWNSKIQSIRKHTESKIYKDMLSIEYKELNKKDRFVFALLKNKFIKIYCWLVLIKHLSKS